jgi:hypothetical protein
MYYNNAENGHHNYVSVHGTGDREGPFYKCPSLAYDAYNQEQLYGDHAINGLGGYNDMHPYDKIEGPRDWYGPAPLSYPEKPTCCGLENKDGKSCDDGHDYDKWDKYHKYHGMHKVKNVPQSGEGGEVSAALELPQLAFDSSRLNLSFVLLLAAAAAGVMYMRNTNMLTNRTLVMVVSALVVLFFLRNLL